MKLNGVHPARSFRGKFAATSMVTLLALAVSASGARACSYSGAPVFAPWGDQHSYALAPDGGFEGGGAGWSLRGGAQVGAPNESFYLNSAADSRSLALPPGSSAGSPPVCVSIDTPIFRLLARNGGDPSSRLRVDAVYRLLGLVRTSVVNTVSAGQAWQPTQPMSVVLGLSTIVGTVLPSSVEVRFTPLDAKGQWQVDDVYIDPFARH